MHTTPALIPREYNLLGGGGLRIEVDDIPEVFEASRSSIHKGMPALFVKTVDAQALIGFLSHQHTKATGALHMGHGDNRFLASTTCRQAVRQG
jgi:hypothetical protein